MLINGHRLQKKYVIFMAVVPLLLSTALIKVDCPIDGGTGMVSSAPGMDRVELINVESEWLADSRDMNACTAFSMYLYDVKLGVVNKGTEDTWGYVKLLLIDLQKGNLVDTQYVVLEIPGGVSTDISYKIWFQSLDDPNLLRTKIIAELIVDDVPCATSKGTGKISLNSWPIVNGLKDIFGELGRLQASYQPPLEFNPDEEQFN